MFPIRPYFSGFIFSISEPSHDVKKKSSQSPCRRQNWLKWNQFSHAAVFLFSYQFQAFLSAVQFFYQEYSTDLCSVGELKKPKIIHF